MNMIKLKIKFTILLLAVCFVFIMGSNAKADNTPFGIGTFLSWNHEWNNYMYNDQQEIDRAVGMLKELGVSIIRNEFSWNEIEATQGVFNFERYDYIVKVCQEQDIEILAVLGFSAPWTGRQWNDAPADETVFLNYVKVVVERYKNSIKYWEFWNEPDTSLYWNPQDSMKTYTQMLKKVYKTIKEIDPSAVIVLGGLANNQYFSLKSVLKNDGADYFDIVNIHPYVSPNNGEGIKQISILINNIDKELAKRNLNKKIWITEIACPGIAQSNASKWWLGESQNEQEQAQFLNEVYALINTHKNVEKIFWSMFRDTDHFKDGIDYFGLLAGDYTPKPAYFAYKQIIDNINKKSE
ncbi:MAG: beta-galactosidase [Candidatus Omnitrophica bacterium]|nr:beta-galactosidase [Candidatus Omnitrophota bacterium]